jgi:predicted choloylglycine hydrolase
MAVCQGEDPTKRKGLMLSLSLAFALLVTPLIALDQGEAAKQPESANASMLTVKLGGTSREMGLKYGQMARDEIHENIDAFWSDVQSQGMSRNELVSKALKSPLPSSISEELVAVSEAAGVAYEDLLAFNNYGASVSKEACTCFVARGDVTLDGNPMSYKTCDVYGYSEVLLIVDPEEGYAHIEVTYAGMIGGPEDGLNEQGLSIGYNWLPVPATDDLGLPPLVMLELILQNCASVQEVIDYVATLPKQVGGNIVVSDTQESAFIEVAPSIYSPDMSYEIITSGFAVHTNHWLYEPFYSWVLDGTNGWDTSHVYVWIPSVSRYDRAMELGEQYSGQLTASLLMSFTRDLTNWGCSPQAVREAHPEWASVLRNGWPGNSICNAQTRSACVIEIDMDNPTMLSTIWTALNNPCFAPFVPLHNAILYDSESVSYAVEQLEPYEGREAFQLAGALKKMYKWGELVPEYVAWESGIIDETAANADQALDYILGGDYTDAANLLAEADCAIALEALELQMDLAAGS